MSEPNRSTTRRGYVIYDEFTDTHGSRVRLQGSPGAEGPRVWVFAEHLDDELPEKWRSRLAAAGFRTQIDLVELAAMLEPSPHLDVEQAKRLRDALDAFIKENSDA